MSRSATVRLTWALAETAELVAEFSVPGEPVSKARARFTNYGSRTRAYTPQKTLDAEKGVAIAFRAAGGRMDPDTEAAFAVEATFHNATRQRRDVDNMLKLILDGLNGVAWVDDAQVMDVIGRKRFVKAKDDARTEVRVYRTGDINRLTGRCANCGKRFPTYRSWPNRKTCSKECTAALRERPVLRTCEHCGEAFEAPSRASVARYCSSRCRRTSGSQRVDCTVCGTTFTTFRSWVGERNFCSKPCTDSDARIRAKERRSTRFPGTCLVCGAGTTRKEYRRCNACKVAGKPVPSQTERSAA